VCGVPVDLGQITARPSSTASREDHIVPWPTAYASTQLLGKKGNVRFVLGASGHIAGVINPPAQGQAQPLGRQAAGRRRSPGSTRRGVPGSWWPAWWLAGRSMPASWSPHPRPRARKHKPIEAAPGRYVKQKA
jgi:polyhydroxyalkanoate synthase